MKITGENEINMYKELKEQIDRWQIEKRDAQRSEENTSSLKVLQIYDRTSKDIKMYRREQEQLLTCQDIRMYIRVD